MTYPLAKLGRVARLVSGVGFPTSFQGRTEGDHPFLKVSDLAIHGGGYRVATARNWVTHRDLATLGARLAPKHSIVFPKVGAALLKNPRRLLSRAAAMDNNLMAVLPQQGDSRYWLYVLSTVDLGELSGSGPLPYVNEGQVRELTVPNPSIETQRRIADFLDAETARLNDLARAYERLRGLIAERLETITDQEIAKHPKLTPFRYMVRFREGPGIMAADFRGDGVPLIRISGLQDGFVTRNGCNYLESTKVVRQWSNFRLKMGDRLVSGSATMGEVSVVSDPAVVGAVPYTGLIILRPAQQGVDMKFVEVFLRSPLFARQIDVLKTGATMQHFGPTHLSQIRAPFPSSEEQIRIVETTQKARSHATRTTKLVNRQLSLLSGRRQALIAAAVTGQFDVSSASGRNVTEGVGA